MESNKIKIQFTKISVCRDYISSLQDEIYFRKKEKCGEIEFLEKIKLCRNAILGAI